MIPIWIVASVIMWDAKKAHAYVYDIEIIFAWAGGLIGIAMLIRAQFNSLSTSTRSSYSQLLKGILNTIRSLITMSRVKITRVIETQRAYRLQRIEAERQFMEKQQRELNERAEKVERDRREKAEKQQREYAEKTERELRERAEREQRDREHQEREIQKEENEIAELMATIQGASDARRSAIFNRLRDELRQAKDDLRHEEQENERALREYNYQPHVYAGCAKVTAEFKGRVCRAERRLHAAEQSL